MTLSSIQTINERLAIEVMGWRKELNVWRMPNGNWEYCHDDANRENDEGLWNPYASIEQAMMVVEKLIERGLRYTLNITRERGAQSAFIDEDEETGVQTIYASRILKTSVAKTACLAAIQALDGQGKE